MSDRDEIPFDLALLARPRYKALPPCCLAALLRLYAAAWTEGNRIPADDDTLAAVSGLNEVYKNSELKRWLARFFAPVNGEPGVLMAIDLESKLAKRRSIGAARRAAGIASGAARRSKNERPENGIEHLFDKDLTEVLLPGDDDTPTPLRRKRKSRAEKAVAPVAPPPPTPVKAVENAQPVPTPVASYPSSRVSMSVCRDTQYTRTQKHLDGGGAGGRGGQLTFWADPEPAPAVSLLPGPEVAAAVVALYVATLKPAYPAEPGAEANVRHWLTHGGHTEAQLKDAIAGYAAATAGKQPRYRKSPANFFSTEDAFFRGWMGKAAPAGPPPEEAVKARIEKAQALALARQKDRAVASDAALRWKETRERMKA